MASFVPPVVIGFATIAANAQPLWTTVLTLPEDGSWSFLRIYNTTNVDLDVSFDASDQAEWVMAGSVAWWDFPNGSTQHGNVRIRGDGADPVSGNVRISGRSE